MSKAMLDCRIEGSIGVVGGLGPFASAEFLKTIYECDLSDCEQYLPTVIMISDPSFPDRTEDFRAGRTDDLLARLTAVLEQLSQLGAAKIIICCVTIHYLLPRLPRHLRARVVSLLDVIFNQVEKSQTRHLLICSSGTRELRLFENHPRWQAASDFIVLPDESDQEIIHRDLIYPMKTTVAASNGAPLLKSLLRKYRVDSFIVGCSEVHILAKAAFPANANGSNCIDPLAILARGIYEKSI